MTRLARRASLLVAFSLLTSAATAYAECAWVLWVHVPRPQLAVGEHLWSISSAASTINECRNEAKAQIESHKSALEALGQQVKTTDYSLTMASKDGSDPYAYSYRCLPDTVDPRGPKGK